MRSRSKPAVPPISGKHGATSAVVRRMYKIMRMISGSDLCNQVELGRWQRWSDAGKLMNSRGCGLGCTSSTGPGRDVGTAKFSDASGQKWATNHFVGRFPMRFTGAGQGKERRS